MNSGFPSFLVGFAEEVLVGSERYECRNKPEVWYWLALCLEI